MILRHVTVDILALGASHVRGPPEGGGLGWVTLRDPECNELCVERSTAERGV